jgi:exopolyphosphatase/guanosine-5'-triphosphate,3'-diphosphate pyrophosphatase
MRRFAVIDVGSNSVRLMLVADGKVLYKRLNTTRLGEGLAQAPYLKEEAAERSAIAVSQFCAQAKEDGAEEIFVFATAATRTAKNKEIFLDRVKELCALSVDVIPGEEEAEIGMLGAIGNNDGAIIDIGGASTEIVVRKDAKILYKKSIDIGVVRLKDLCGRDKVALENISRVALEEFGSVPKETIFYGIGGTATTLAAQNLGLLEYVSDKITGTTISFEEVTVLADKFAAMSLEEIAALPCMPKGRADVILGGAVLLATLMKTLGIGQITVSDRDNLEGYAIKRGLME